MEGGKIVVDGSLRREYGKEALIIRDSFTEGLVDIVAPSLLYFEVP